LTWLKFRNTARVEMKNFFGEKRKGAKMTHFLQDFAKIRFVSFRFLESQGLERVL
jgi:hypothetical protein